MDASHTIRKKIGDTKIEAALVLGSGLAGLADILEHKVVFPYAQLEGFPGYGQSDSGVSGSGVSGHGSDLLIGKMGGKSIAILTGREHYYEHGNAAAMRVALETVHTLGASTLFLTNSAGSLDEKTRPGSLMMLKDHINYAGMNPLIGEPTDKRFVNMVDAYDPFLRKRAISLAQKLDIPLSEGVYLWYSGPSLRPLQKYRCNWSWCKFCWYVHRAGGNSCANVGYAGLGLLGDHQHGCRNGKRDYQPHPNQKCSGGMRPTFAKTYSRFSGGIMNLKAVTMETSTANAQNHKRNPGFELDMDWVDQVRMNRSALERRAGSIGARRSVKKNYQAAWLLKAITMIDLTSLNSDDTPGRVKRLCAKARRPVRNDILSALGAQNLDIRPGAVCVYHNFVGTAVEALAGSNIPVAAVSTAFPHGLTPLEIRLLEIEASVKAGAKEIDIVIERGMVLEGDWQGLYDQIKAMRAACGEAHIKTILGTGELATQTNVAKASLVCMLAGADFIKTSTGKEKVNANLQTSLAMIRMIRWFFEETGIEIGYKPAGGISKAKDSLTYLALIKEELGINWLQPHLFRFGASSLLTDIERQLEHQVTGRYAADYRQPMV